MKTAALNQSWLGARPTRELLGNGLVQYIPLTQTPKPEHF